MDDAGHLEDLAPGDAGDGIEIDAQFVGMVEVFGAHRMWVQLETGHVGHPRERGGVPRHEFVGAAARRKAQRDDLGPGRPRFGRALLVEEFALDAVRIADEDVGASAGRAQGAVGDREVVADEIQLGVAGVGKEHLRGVGDRHFAAGGDDDFLGRFAGMARPILPRATCYVLRCNVRTRATCDVRRATCTCDGVRRATGQHHMRRPMATRVRSVARSRTLRVAQVARRPCLDVAPLHVARRTSHVARESIPAGRRTPATGSGRPRAAARPPSSWSRRRAR